MLLVTIFFSIPVGFFFEHLKNLLRNKNLFTFTDVNIVYNTGYFITELIYYK